MRDRPETQRGFTLIEMLVVLTVMGLLLAIAVIRGPTLSPAIQARSAAAQVVQGLRLARARAIMLNRPIAFNLDVATHDFRIEEAAAQPLPPALLLSMVTVAGKASQQQRIGAISFAPDGSSSGGRIELAGNGIRLEIGVDWLTGRVSVANEK